MTFFVISRDLLLYLILLSSLLGCSGGSKKPFVLDDQRLDDMINNTVRRYEISGPGRVVDGVPIASHQDARNLSITEGKAVLSGLKPIRTSDIGSIEQFDFAVFLIGGKSPITFVVALDEDALQFQMLGEPIIYRIAESSGFQNAVNEIFLTRK